jgi:hypothetical protein
MTNDRLALADWLRAEGCGPVVRESTESFWRPTFNALEEQCEVLVVNADHVQAVLGRKTAGKDAEWLADLLRHGRHARQLYPLPCPAPPARSHPLSHPPRRLATERAWLTNRLQTVREDANSKLAAVVPDVRGLCRAADPTAPARVGRHIARP